MAEAGGGASRQWLGWAWRVVGSVLLLALLLVNRQVRDELASLPPETIWWVLGAAVLYIGSQAVNTVKWQLILDGLGHRRRFGQLYAVTLAGMFGNLFLPTTVGGDVLRVGLISADGVPASLGLLSVFIQRVTGLVALLVIGVVGLAVSGELGEPVPRQVLVGLSVLLGALLVATVIGVLAETRLGLARRLPTPLSRPLLKLGAGARALAGQPRVLWLAIWWSFVFQLSHVGLGVLLALPAAGTVAARHYLWLVPILNVGGMVPVGLGGVGSREQTANLWLMPFTGSAGVVWAALWSAMVIVASLPGGLALAGMRRSTAKESAAEAAAETGDAAAPPNPEPKSSDG